MNYRSVQDLADAIDSRDDLLHWINHIEPDLSLVQIGGEPLDERLIAAFENLRVAQDDLVDMLGL